MIHDDDLRRIFAAIATAAREDNTSTGVRIAKIMDRARRKLEPPGGFRNDPDIFDRADT